MIDFLFDAIGDLWDNIEDMWDSISDTDLPSVPIDVEDMLLIGGAIYIANITASSIKDELRKRKDLPKNGTQVVFDDFFEKNGQTEISVKILDPKFKVVGKTTIKGKTCSGIYKGQILGYKD